MTGRESLREARAIAESTSAELLYFCGSREGVRADLPQLLRSYAVCDGEVDVFLGTTLDIGEFSSCGKKLVYKHCTTGCPDWASWEITVWAEATSNNKDAFWPGDLVVSW